MSRLQRWGMTTAVAFVMGVSCVDAAFAAECSGDDLLFAENELRTYPRARYKDGTVDSSFWESDRRVLIRLLQTCPAQAAPLLTYVAHKISYTYEIQDSFWRGRWKPIRKLAMDLVQAMGPSALPELERLLRGGVGFGLADLATSLRAMTPDGTSRLKQIILDRLIRNQLLPTSSHAFEGWFKNPVYKPLQRSDFDSAIYLISKHADLLADLEFKNQVEAGLKAVFASWLGQDQFPNTDVIEELDRLVGGTYEGSPLFNAYREVLFQAARSRTTPFRREIVKYAGSRFTPEELDQLIEPYLASPVIDRFATDLARFLLKREKNPEKRQRLLRLLVVNGDFGPRGDHGFYGDAELGREIGNLGVEPLENYIREDHILKSVIQVRATPGDRLDQDVRGVLRYMAWTGAQSEGLRNFLKTLMEKQPYQVVDPQANAQAIPHLGALALQLLQGFGEPKQTFELQTVGSAQVWSKKPGFWLIRGLADRASKHAVNACKALGGSTPKKPVFQEKTCRGLNQCDGYSCDYECKYDLSVTCTF
jgi:hypothetical protein